MKQPTNYQLVIERIVPWLILTLLGVFTYANFFRIPYVGFDFARGEIVEINSPTSQEILKVNDQLKMVGSVSMDTFRNDLRQTIFEDLEVGQSVPLLIERKGKDYSIDWIYPGPDRIQVLQRFNDIWWLPYVFWMAGTAALLFIRPKDMEIVDLIQLFDCRMAGCREWASSLAYLAKRDTFALSHLALLTHIHSFSLGLSKTVHEVAQIYLGLAIHSRWYFGYC